MSFGFSPGDLISIANAAHAIYNAFKNSAGDLVQKLSTFEDVSQELNRLNNVLKGAGIDEYPDTTELERSMTEALEYFGRYTPILPGQGKLLSKVAKTAKFSLDKAVVERYAQEMKRHRKKMHKFTMDIILYKTLHDSQLQQTFLYAMTSAADNTTRARHQSIDFSTNKISDKRLLERSADNDQAIAISVRRAIGWTSHLNDTDSFSSDAMPLPAQTENPAKDLQSPHSANETARVFADIVTDLAEASIRYLSDTPASAPPDEVAQTINFLDQFKKAVTGSPNFAPMQTWSNSASPQYLPYRPSSIISTNTDADSNLNSPLLTFSRSVTASTPATSITTSPVSPEYQIGEPSISTDTILPQRESSMSVLSQTDVQHMLVLNSAISGAHQITCRVKLSSREALVSLSTPIVRDQALVATPGQILRIRAADSAPSHANIFEHRTEQLNSFPVILHPAADVSSSTSTFTVDFYRTQSFIRRDDESTSAKRKVRYICKSKSDRKVLCEMLHGKKLLASAGVERTTIEKSCDQQNLMLWLDKISQITSEPSVYVTIPSNSSNQRSQPDHVQEYIVESCQNIKRARESGKRLMLTLRSTSNPRSPTKTDQRRESDLSTRSSTTVRSWASSGSVWRRSSDSAQIPCEITFSEDTEKFRQKKKEFIDALAKAIGQ